MVALRVTETREQIKGHNFIVVRPKEFSGNAVMVFLHGASGYAKYFTSLMGYFAERGSICIAPDIVGHGERAYVDIRKAGIENYVFDMRDFIARVVDPYFSLRPRILVGHSMGGLIAQKLAEEGLCDRLILITPAPPHGVRYVPGRFSVPSFHDAAGFLRTIFFREPFTPSRKLISSFFADPVRSARMIDAWCKERIAGESLVALYELGMSAIEVDPTCITMPALVIGAEKDVVIHKSVATAIARYYGAHLQMIPDLGHMCVFEYGWEKTASRMHQWLALIK